MVGDDGIIPFTVAGKYDNEYLAKIAAICAVLLHLAGVKSLSQSPRINGFGKNYAGRRTRDAMADRTSDEYYRDDSADSMNFHDRLRTSPFRKLHIGRYYVRATSYRTGNSLSLGGCKSKGCCAFILKKPLYIHRDDRFVFDYQNVAHSKFHCVGNA